MKAPLFLVLASLLAVEAVADPRYVTLTVKQITGASDNRPVAEMSIDASETLEGVAYVRELNPSAALARIEVMKDGLTIQATSTSIVAGPASIRLLLDGPGQAFLTVKVTPGPAPPDKAMIIPAGPGGAVITLECSTNLVNWTPASSGVYTNLPAAKFFRIRTDRINP